MKYRVCGVQYYWYDTEATSAEAAKEEFYAMMQHGTGSEIDRLKSGEPIAVKAFKVED